ncbi:hypothetical protein GUITHDRAFT_152313, partial [Guillardia theta CCMP2712]
MSEAVSETCSSESRHSIEKLDIGEDMDSEKSSSARRESANFPSPSKIESFSLSALYHLERYMRARDDKLESNTPAI